MTPLSVWLIVAEQTEYETLVGFGGRFSPNRDANVRPPGGLVESSLSHQPNSCWMAFSIGPTRCLLALVMIT
ncbi:hypothetical protein SBV1_3030017 [Verrucomicrobia bacterium]|nr:hypothetical protein SBV1_3030017 [Verrucomicrobiota bacterium]